MGLGIRSRGIQTEFHRLLLTSLSPHVSVVDLETARRCHHAAIHAVCHTHGPDSLFYFSLYLSSITVPPPSRPARPAVRPSPAAALLPKSTNPGRRCWATCRYVDFWGDVGCRASTCTINTGKLVTTWGSQLPEREMGVGSWLLVLYPRVLGTLGCRQRTCRLHTEGRAFV